MNTIQRLMLAASCVAACTAHITFAVPFAAAQSTLPISMHAAQSRLMRLAPTQPSDSATLRIDQATMVVIDFTSPLEGISTSITTPTGAIIDPATVAEIGGRFEIIPPTPSSGGLLVLPASRRGFTYRYEFPSPGPGEYSASVVATPAGETPVILSMTTDSSIRSSMFVTENEVALGKFTVICVPLLDGSTPIPGASVTAFVRVPGSPLEQLVAIELHDDGLDFDGVAGDGLYSAGYHPEVSGTHSVAVEVTGQRLGVHFARSSGTRFKAVAPGATFRNSTLVSAGIDDNSNGLYDRLSMTGSLNVVSAGTYAMNVRLTTPAGRELWITGDFATLAAGMSSISASIGAQALRDNAENGPYTITAAEIFSFGSDGPFLADRLEFLTIQTPAYPLTQFERPPLELTGTITDVAMNTGGDARFDVMRVDVGMNVRRTGTYSFTVQLVDSCGRQIQFITGQQTLTSAPGPQQLTLNFSGSLIGMNGVNGPYTVRNLLVLGSGASLVAPLVGMTQPFLASSFDSYHPFADCNANGAPDACDIAAGTSRDYNLDQVPDECQCLADWNHSGEVNPQDLWDFMSDFVNMRADYNASGSTDSQDFFDFLTDFFRGC